MDGDCVQTTGEVNWFRCLRVVQCSSQQDEPSAFDLGDIVCTVAGLSMTEADWVGIMVLLGGAGSPFQE